MATSYENSSSSSDENEFQQVQGDIVPYRFEPVFSREDLETRRRENEERTTRTSDSEATDRSDQNSTSRSRTGDKFWCTCELCVLMPTTDECICCHEVQQSRAMVDKFDPDTHQNLLITGEEESTRHQKCVTQHPDFEAHLNDGVLDTYFRSHRYNWKLFPKPRGPRGTLTNAQYRLVGYRFILDWLLQGERLWRKKRIPLPACVVYKIRQKYPADDNEYSGFKYAELHPQ